MKKSLIEQSEQLTNLYTDDQEPPVKQDKYNLNV